MDQWQLPQPLVPTEVVMRPDLILRQRTVSQKAACQGTLHFGADNAGSFESVSDYQKLSLTCRQASPLRVAGSGDGRWRWQASGGQTRHARTHDAPAALLRQTRRRATTSGDGFDLARYARPRA